MFEQFPYTNFHELNLDWIIKKVQEAYSPDNPPTNVVLSVDGQTGNVQVFPNAIVRLPDVSAGTWNIHRLANGTSRGIQFTPNGAERIEGTNRYKLYDETNIPVKSVNGLTGDVELFTDALIRLPDILDETWNVRRTANGVSRGIQFTPNGTVRIEGTNRLLMYDSSNLPKTVNDREQPIMEIAIPSDTTTWGFTRQLEDGSNATIYLQKSGDSVKAYISYISADDQTSETMQLLTSADIPSSSGVVSINGKAGVVTIDGTEIYIDPTSAVTIAQALATLSNKNASQDVYIAQNSTAIQAETNRASAVEANVEKAFAIIVNGDNAGTAIPAGNYAYIKNNSHGLAEGLYQATAMFPAAGGVANSSSFTPVNNGGLNALKNNVDTINGKLTTTQILYELNIPTTATSYSCNWSAYTLLIIDALYYNNVTTSIIVPSQYFNNTTSSIRVILTDPSSNVSWNIYKNGNNAVYISSSAVDANAVRGVRIYGML